LVICTTANWAVVYDNQNIERRSTTIHNAPQWLTRLCQHLQKAQEDVRALAAAVANADTMDIDVSELRNDYKILSEAATSLF
jgi:hypothetical protein